MKFGYFPLMWLLGNLTLLQFVDVHQVVSEIIPFNGPGLGWKLG